jgi:hypothetical protein
VGTKIFSFYDSKPLRLPGSSAGDKNDVPLADITGAMSH